MLAPLKRYATGTMLNGGKSAIQAAFAWLNLA